MEQGMMDAEGGRVIHRRKRTGTLAVVVAVQNVVVAACLIATLFLYLDFPKDVSTLWVERLSGELVGKDAHTWFVFKNTLDDFFKTPAVQYRVKLLNALLSINLKLIL